MTDTAVPLPETESVPDDGSLLTADQRRRVEALQVARRVLENKPSLFAGSKLESVRCLTVDLMILADWVLNGSDDVDTVDLLDGFGRKVASIPTRPEGNMPTATELVDDHDAEADAELRNARSDADDGN